GAEYMLTADILIELQIGYKYTLDPLLAESVWGGYTTEVVIDDVEMSLGGLNIGLGFSYALAELPFNLFGFMDPMRKY
ncbi:MAG: hypothetical protein P9L91_05805, partial [Candidatus Zophobacter franzmannii]|nr:hypothetical protein [Candidatus Zophobacter franzmannii]